MTMTVTTDRTLKEGLTLFKLQTLKDDDDCCYRQDTEGGTYPFQTQTLKDDDVCCYRQETEEWTYPIQTTDIER